MPVRFKIASIVEHAIFHSVPFSLNYNVVTMPYFMCILNCYIYNISSGVSWSICAIIKMLFGYNGIIEYSSTIMDHKGLDFCG